MAEYKNGMTKEYFNTLDSMFKQQMGQGFSGDLANSLKSNRGLADEFNTLLNSKSLIKSGGKIIIDPKVAASDPALKGIANKLNFYDESQDIKTNATNEAITADTANIDNAVTSGFIDATQAATLKNLMNSGQGDYAKELLGTYTKKYMTDKDALANPVPSFVYNEPQAIKDAKAAIAQDMGIDPLTGQPKAVEFNPDIVKQWMPTITEAQAPARQADLDQNAGLMNSMGRLFSGQTLNRAGDIGNKYSMDAMNKAFGYGAEDYATRKANREGAINKNLALGEYETGIAKYKNEGDVSEALRNLQNTWSGINNTNATRREDYMTSLGRLFGDQDWTKNANLSKELALMNKPEGMSDYEKILAGLNTVSNFIPKTPKIV